MDTWRTTSPQILPPCVCQECEVCWAVALIHQFEANLKLKGELGRDEHLSIQELINILPRSHRNRDGTIHGSVFARDSLTKHGTVLESVCPLTYALDTPGKTPERHDVKRFLLKRMWTKYLVESVAEFGAAFGYDVFEDALRQKAKIAPVTVRIWWTPSYITVAGKGGIYQPTVDEIADARYGHFLLVLGPVTIDGVDCWECQDSFGPCWGRNGGRVYIRRRLNVVTEFIEMKV